MMTAPVADEDLVNQVGRRWHCERGEAVAELRKMKISTNLIMRMSCSAVIAAQINITGEEEGLFVATQSLPQGNLDHKQ